MSKSTRERPTAFVSEIEFSGGQKLFFEPTDKVLIVGPNNGGKSQSLRDIKSIASATKVDGGLAITSLKITKNGSAEDLTKFLDTYGRRDGEIVHYLDWKVHQNLVPGWWNSAHLAGHLLDGYVRLISATDRLKICEEQKSTRPDEPKTKPQQVLYDDDELLAKVSQAFLRAFGKNLLIDYRGGPVIPIHVGDRPPEGIADRASSAYVRELQKNPSLFSQGDGMKSFAGILFETLVNPRDVMLLDEPEAFLHPPQMRRLAETLAREVSGQLFVATHSSDVLRGFLEGTKGDLKIIRITRDGDRNAVSLVAPESAIEIWSRPELRYSSAFDGVFHEQAIICEDDSDCRLYNAMADHIEERSAVSFKDTCYIPAGGKHAVKKIAASLRAVGVPVKAVFDLDLLSDSALTLETFGVFGGDPEEILPALRRLDMAIRNGVKPKTVDEIKVSIVEILDSAPAGTIPRSIIVDELKQTSPWNVVKRHGVAAIPNGAAQKDFEAIDTLLRRFGIFLVPVGEAERFCRKIDAHGPKFVNNLLSSVSLDDESLGDLRKFVGEVQQG